MKHMPQAPSLHEDGPIVINNTGRFVLKGIPGTVPLNETGDMLFEYLCFLNVNRFWKKVEAIRNFNHVSWPLLICGLPAFAETGNDKTNYLKAALSLNRQLFVCKPITRTEKEDIE